MMEGAGAILCGRPFGFRINIETGKRRNGETEKKKGWKMTKRRRDEGTIGTPVFFDHYLAPALILPRSGYSIVVRKEWNPGFANAGSSPSALAQRERR